jgi:hypothetical protein
VEVREKLIDVPLPPVSTSGDGARSEFVVEVPLSSGRDEVAVGVLDRDSRLVTYLRLTR